MNTFAKHWRIVFLILGIIILFWVLYLLRAVVLPFAFGLVLAYLLIPVVSWIERKLPRQEKWPRLKRVLSTLAVFMLLIAIVGVFSYLIVTVVIDASLALVQSAPDIASRSVYQIQKWLEVLRQQFPPEIRLELDKALIEGGAALGKSIRDALLGGISSVPGTFSTVFGFAVLPFFLFYIMKDSEKLKRSFYSALTPGMAEHARNIILVLERVLGRYIRAQLMLGIIVAYFAFIGLLLLKVEFAPVLAMLAGITELIPTLGPWIGGGVAVVVTLALAPEKAIWVAVLFVAIQLVENSFLVPRIQSAYLHIHPAIMVVLLVVGAYVAGFWGLLLIAPLSATVMEIYKYVYHVYQVEKDGQQAEQGQSAV